VDGRYRNEVYTGSDDDVQNLTRNPLLTIVKTQTSTEPITTAGQVITYQIVITNTGNITLTGAVATETFPGTGANTFSDVTESITTNGILEVGETWTHTASYTVTQGDIDRGEDLVNTISLVTVEYPGPTIATAITPVANNASIDILKAADEQIYSVEGDIIPYTIVVTNTGNVTLTDIHVTDPLTGLDETIASLTPGAS
jgi:uncharacterized repeat protein (TIGR01451 family)